MQPSSTSRGASRVSYRRIFRLARPPACLYNLFCPEYPGVRPMKVPLKLNSIDQEHLQELYNGAGVARDELPYSAAFDEIVQGFQDRTFKNATHEQVFAAILKYTRSSSNASTELPPGELTEEQQKQLKAVLSRHNVGGKM